MKQLTIQQRKKRKALLVQPILILPFLTLLFWALGGGSDKVTAQVQKDGINTGLPGARNDSGRLDKMSLYKKAALDSADRRQLEARDPFFSMDQAPDSFPVDSSEDTGLSMDGGGLKTSSWTYHTDPNERKVQDRLKKLDEMLNQPASPEQPYPSLQNSSAHNSDIDRLQQMVQTVTAQGTDNQDMKQLSDMLEKILDIQNPARAQEKLKEQSRMNRGRVFPVSKPQKQLSADYLAGSSRAFNGKVIDSVGPVPVIEPLTERNGFYDLPEPDNADEMQTAIPAVIHGTQTLISGSSVKMRLLEEVMINGVLIPQGSFVTGNCSINGERLTIEVPGLRYGKNIFPVSLSVYGLDGLEGISIPGAMTRDAAKDGMDRTMQNMQLMSLDPSIGAQAASAGVEVAKGLFGKKVKLVRVTVKADYPVLLMDAKAKQDLQ